MVVVINDHEILIANVDGTYYAVDNVCTCITAIVGHKRNGEASDPHTHGGRLARLQHGDIEEAHIRCPTHESVYDLRTGHPLSGFAEIALNTYEVLVDGDNIQIAEMADCDRHFWNDAGNQLRP